MSIAERLAAAAAAALLASLPVAAPAQPPGAAPAAVAAAVSCSSPVGTWAWWDGSVVSFLADGTSTHSKGAPGRWERQSDGRYHVHWPTWNSDDYFTISSDGRTMSGNYAGNGGVSRRQTPAACLGSTQTVAAAVPCSSPVGTWAWWDGSVVSFLGDGTSTHSKGAPGRWERQSDGRYHVHWPTWNSDDYFTISSDGRTMSGNYAGNGGVSRRTTAC